MLFQNYFILRMFMVYLSYNELLTSSCDWYPSPDREEAEDEVRSPSPVAPLSSMINESFSYSTL